MVRGFYKLIGLLAAVTLEQIHGIHWYCVASNVIFVHGGLLTFSAINAGPPLYTPNDSHVITPYLVVTVCRPEGRAGVGGPPPPNREAWQAHFETPAIMRLQEALTPLLAKPAERWKMYPESSLG